MNSRARPPVLAVAGFDNYHRATVPREVKKLLEVSENIETKRLFEEDKISWGAMFRRFYA